jgi:hypothetical protein
MFTFAKITIKKLFLLSVFSCVLFGLKELIHFRIFYMNYKLVPLEKAETKFVSSLNLIDLKKPFGINQEYLDIPCRVSSEVNRVQTVVCVNDPKTETIGERI